MLWVSVRFLVPGTGLSTPTELMAWIGRHPDQVGLVVLPDGAGDPTVALNADQLFPLASTKKVLIATAYAVDVAAGKLAPDSPVSLRELARWYWPGTDGGAHTHALAEWKSSHLISSERTVPISAVAQAMIRWSDNAAADYLLARVGGPAAVAAAAKRLGMTSQQPVWPHPR
jgi:D-alanyl-D-alanine carboxypeptidase